MNPTDDTKIHIMDITGKTVLKQIFQAEAETTIYGSVFTDKGLYFLVLTSGDETKTMKLLVK